MTARQLAALLRKLEQHHGSVDFAEPTDPYELIVHTNCGYPPSQENCRKGFEALKSSVGISAGALLAATREARKALKRFPTIGDPGVDKILLFCADIPVAAVPSNCPHVPLRLGLGVERPSYAATYRSVQEELTRMLSGDAAAMKRAYLLFRQHGKTLCRRTVPLCDRCPVAAMCPYRRAPAEKCDEKKQ